MTDIVYKTGKIAKQCEPVKVKDNSPILTYTTPFCSKTIKTNDFRFIIRSGEKVLQQRVVTYTCNIGGSPIKEESVEWKDIETIDNKELK